MKTQLPVVLKVQVAFGAVMAVLLIVGIVTYRSVVTSFDSAQWAQHTNEVLEHLANLRLRTENIENGYRDFALSGTDAFLQQSRATAPLAANELQALRALTEDNPRQQRRLSMVADLLQAIVRSGDTIERLRRTPAAEDTAAVMRSGQDASLLDAFRIAARRHGSRRATVTARTQIRGRQSLSRGPGRLDRGKHPGIIDRRRLRLAGGAGSNRNERGRKTGSRPQSPVRNGHRHKHLDGASAVIARTFSTAPARPRSSTANSKWPGSP